MSTSSTSRACACTEQQQESSNEGLHPRETGGRRPLRKCRKRGIAAFAFEPQGPAKKKTKTNATTRSLALKSTLSFHIPEDDSTEQPFVTDDDEDSISSAETNRPANPRSTDKGVPPTAPTFPPEEVCSPPRASPPPPTPLPTRLTQAQIHSKSYTFPHKLFDLMEDNAASDGNGNGNGNGNGDESVKLRIENLKRRDRTPEDPGVVLEFCGCDPRTKTMQWKTKHPSHHQNSDDASRSRSRSLSRPRDTNLVNTPS